MPLPHTYIPTYTYTRISYPQARVVISTVVVAAASLYYFHTWSTRKVPPKQHLRLIYLDIKGVAEPIRLTFAIGGVQFEDRRISYEEVARMRDERELPYGQVPLLEINGETFAQTNAILKWAGSQSGLYPQDLQLKIDGVEEALADIKKALIPQ